MIDYSTLETGQELSKQSLTLDPDAVSKYVAAVDDTSNPTAKTALRSCRQWRSPRSL